MQIINERKLTFDNFVVSGTNEKAYRDCIAFAQGDAPNYGFYLLSGPSPCGKTHLLHAIRNEIVSSKNEAKVCYVSFNEFLAEYIKGLKKRDFKEFKQLYSSFDVLLIDNAQFWAGKNITQEYLLERFSDWCLAGQRIMLASDVPLSRFKTLCLNLKNKIVIGICSIEKPDYMIRKKYIQTKLEHGFGSLSQDCIEYIARSEQIPFSALPGLLAKLYFLREVMGKNLDMNYALEVIKSYEI